MVVAEAAALLESSARSKGRRNLLFPQILYMGCLIQGVSHTEGEHLCSQLWKCPQQTFLEALSPKLFRSRKVDKQESSQPQRPNLLR